MNDPASCGKDPTTIREKRPPRRYYQLSDEGRIALGAVLQQARRDVRFTGLVGGSREMAEPAPGARRVRVRPGILPASDRSRLPSWRPSPGRVDRRAVRRALRPAAPVGRRSRARSRGLRGSLKGLTRGLAGEFRSRRAAARRPTTWTGPDAARPPTNRKSTDAEAWFSVQPRAKVLAKRPGTLCIGRSGRLVQLCAEHRRHDVGAVHSRPINRRISGEGHAERSSASVSNSLRMWPGA